MLEHERSFVFAYDDEFNWLNWTGSTSLQIKDYYLSKELRVRHSIGDKEQFYVTRKTGLKVSGKRHEQESLISETAAYSLMQESKLLVNKTRHVLTVPNQGYRVFVDRVHSPMKLSILEIESDDEVSDDISRYLLNRELELCPLSAWDLFQRKIGICGAPSSGKSSTAQKLSQTLNIEYGANAFHVMEYATSFIQKYNRVPDFHDQFLVWYGQRDREANATKANIVVSDCPTFLSYIYILEKTSKFNDQTAMFLCKMYKRVLFDTLNYTDIIFMRLVDYAENGVRYQSFAQAKDIEGKIWAFLDNHKINHITIDYTSSDSLIDRLFYINK